MSASRAVSVMNSSTTTRKSRARNARTTVDVSGFCGMGLPRSTHAIFNGGSVVASICGPSIAVEIDTRTTPSGEAWRIERDGIRLAAEHLRAQVGEDPARPRLADVPRERHQRQHRAHRLPAVGVALHAEARADRHRRARADEFGETRDLRLRDVGNRRRPRGRARPRTRSRNSSAPCTWLRDERLIDPAALEEHVRDRERDGRVGARARLHVQRRAFSRLGAPRIDDDERGAPVERLLDERHLVDVRLRGVLPPQDDEAGVGEIPRRVVLLAPSVRRVASRPAGQQRSPYVVVYPPNSLQKRSPTALSRPFVPLDE